MLLKSNFTCRYKIIKAWSVEAQCESISIRHDMWGFKYADKLLHNDCKAIYITQSC